MSFKKFLAEQNVNEAKDPPMLLQLRRQGIRNFPNGERVALFSNPQLNIQLAVPYDSVTGSLKPTNALPIKEESLVENEESFHDVLTRHGYTKSDRKHNGYDVYDKIDHNSKVSMTHHGTTRSAMADSSGHHAVMHTTSQTTLTKPHKVVIYGSSWNYFKPTDKPPGSPGKQGSKFGYTSKELDRHLKKVHKPIQEETKDDCDDRTKKITCLQYAYQSLIVPQPTELQKSLHNWLKSELEEYGDWSDMPDDVLCDVHDDFVALVRGSSLEHDLLGESLQEKYSRPIRKINNFADWHEQMERKGEVQFKIHDAGNKTSGYLNGNHVGTYNHKVRKGEIHEELVQESPLHRINTILRTGQEDHVTFHNGASARVHPNTARTVHQLYHKVNSQNRAKLSELINGSPEGLVRVARFADELTKKNTEAK